MSLKIYCPSCAEANEYTLNKPIFCGHCGSKLSNNSTASVSQKPVTPQSVATQKVPQKPVSQIELEDDIVEVEIPSKLEVEIESFGDSRGVTFEDVAKQRKTGFSRPRAKRVNVKQTIAEFQREARPKTRQEREIETIQDTGKE